MLKLGAVTIDVSHPKTFSGVLHAGTRARYAAVFNDGFRQEDEVQAFADGLQLTVCSDIHQLVDMVDIGMIHACNWDKHLDYIMPFIEKGKPVFVDKPLVGNLRDAARLLELEKAGARILGTSALRYCEETKRIREQAAQNDAKVLHVTAAVGVDEFNYAIHGFEAVCAMIADRPVSARYLGRGATDKETCDSYMLRFAGGATAMIHNLGKKWTPFHMMVLMDKSGDCAYTVDGTKLYVPMMEYLCDALEGKENPLATVEEMLVPIRAALACKASRLSGGKEISLDDPVLESVSYDGYAFEREYAANAKKIFV